ncbi:MAG TPA: ABC transporter ATP-binding protein, partial [Thermoanaerobaculia bacterium]
RTDAMLRQALRGPTRDKTVIIVAQRIGTIINADKIVVLDEGRIVGEGTHRELMETCEVYREIALSQLSEHELAGGGLLVQATT